ncbi:MAG: FG-GAP repeat domain-containing protein [Planctomycetota bacterium]
MIQPRSRSVALLLATAAFSAACARHSGDIAGLSAGTPPAFETRTEIDTGSPNHSDYRVADFDGDGVLDMAVISLSGELQVLLGNGATFVPGQLLEPGGFPVWMSGGDFDNDGDEDLVVVRSDANETTLFENDGSGNFSQGSSLAAGSDALAVVVGDFNNDSLLDVAVARPAAPAIVVGLGNGELGFSSTQNVELPGGGTAFNLAAGDADRDGSTDLIVADTGFSRLVVFRGDAQGNVGANPFQLDVPGTVGAVTFGDLSGDGQQDMVASAFTANRYVVITDVVPSITATGPGGVPNWTFDSFDIEVPARPSLARVGDVNGDGLNDLVACLAFNAMVAVVEGNGPGTFDEPMLLDASGLPLRPFLGDFDQNGRLDVFALSGLGNRVNLWLARDGGTLVGSRSYGSTLSSASWMEGGDFDGDGDFEVVVGSNADTQLAILGGQGALAEESLINVGAEVFQLEAADLNFDGLSDLIVSVQGGVRILRNQSTPGAYSFELLPGTFATVGSGVYPFGVTVGDFDRDADFDLAVCDYIGGNVHIVPGTEEPFVFDTDIVLGVGGGPVDIVSADFSGDGLQDLAITRANDSDITILRNEGELQFVETMTVPVGLAPSYLVTSDFNRDGRADLVVSNGASGTVSVLFGEENGFTGSDFAAGASPTALLARDLTGDGIEDILVASLQSGDFRVLVGDGQGSFPLVPSFPGTLGASDAVLQDMTGDGLPELLISSLISNRVSLVRNIRQQ